MTKRLRGVNLGGWFSQIDAIQGNNPEHFIGEEAHLESFLGPEDFRRIQGWGFDHVRLPVDYFNVFESEALTPRAGRLAQLDRAITQLNEAGLDVMFDLHKCPGHDFHAGGHGPQRFFVDAETRERAKRVWAMLAERYGGNPRVLLEILNEPVAEDSADWDRVKTEMATHIRRYAPRSTLVVGTNRWSHPAEFTKLTPLEDDNVLYNFHFYSSLLFTHQHAPWLSGEVFRVSRPYPGDYTIPPDTVDRHPLDPGRWDKRRMEKELEDVFDFRERHGVPVLCNEFGVFVGGADRASQLRWMDDFLALLEAHRIGFSYWNYKNLDFGLISVNEPRFQDYPQYRNPEQLDSELVAVLRRH
jgi:endoglucanase